MTTKVVIFSSEWDTGGQGYRIKAAFDKYQPDFSVRSIHLMGAYFDYPTDILATDQAEVYRLFDEADVIHMRNGLEGLRRLGSAERRTVETPAKLVVHYHGTKFREEHHRLSATARLAGAVQLVSTIDLMLLEEGLRWLPSPFDLVELADYREAAEAERESQDYVRVVHSPTNRLVKSTKAVMEAIQVLSDSGLHVKLDLIERKTWRETLVRKSKADLCVDQLKLGYGNNAIEAWGMGIPVIAGVEDEAVRAAMLDVWGELPFFEATEETVASAIAELATDSAARAYWGQVGRRFVERFHDERDIADHLANIYRSTN